MKTNKLDQLIGCLFAVSGAFLLITFILAFAQIETFLFAQYMVKAFYLASFYMPLYLFAQAYLFFKRKASFGTTLIANLTFIPFLTLAVIFGLFSYQADESSKIISFFYNFLGPGAIIVLLGLFLLEILVIFRIADMVLKNEENLEETPEDETSDDKTSDDETPKASFFEKKIAFFKPKLKQTENAYRAKEPPAKNEAGADAPEKDSNDEVVDTLRKSLDTIDAENQDTSAVPHQDANAEPHDEEVDFNKSDLNEAHFNFAKASDESLVADEGVAVEADDTFKEDDMPKLNSSPDNLNFLEPDESTAQEIDKIHFEDLQQNANKEFISELEREENRPKPLDVMDHDIESSFKDKIKALQEQSESMPFVRDKGFDFLGATNAYEEGQTFFSPEEEEALNLAAIDIAQSAEEETKIASLIDDANKKLDFALNNDISYKDVDATDDDEALEKEETEKKKLAVVASTSLEQEDQILADVDEDDDSGLENVDEDVSFESVDEEEAVEYKIPIDGILDSYDKYAYGVIDEETKNAATALESVLQEFRIEAKVIAIRKGPVITMFELLPAPGVKLSRIENLADNIAFRLAASRVRIVAPIPGKQAVGIEIPNRERAVVTFSELITDKEMQNNKNYIPFALGKDIEGRNQIIDLAKTPHLLIAGATGAGKSVCINAIICSILYTRTPRDVRLLLIDPKVVELKPYNDIPHLLTPVITEPKKALQAVNWAIYEMDRRYSLLDSLGAKSIRSYNKKIKEQAIAAMPLPYIVVIIDEFADLIASCGKDLEVGIARLAAKSRAAGIHLILATQRPSADVITGLIKANFPSRIAFMVASKVDSRIILDMSGAEQLLGRGDLLFTSSWDPFPVRMQGAYLSEDEVENIANYAKSLGKPDYIDDQIFDDDDDGETLFTDDQEDPFYTRAVDIVVEQNKASASYLQRRLKIGYNRAARLIEMMEERGVVGPANGSKARDVLKSY